MADAVLARASIPGLPSRGPALSPATVAGVLPTTPVETATGIVEQASAVLSSEPQRVNPVLRAPLATGIDMSSQDAWAGQLEAQVRMLVDQFVALAGQRPAMGVAIPQTGVLGQRGSADDQGRVTLDPAPVLSPSGSVAPGGTAQISISLVNDDDQPARIAFLSTGLVGDDGTQIAAENVSFQPHELTLQPGTTGVVLVRVTIPAQARCGVYSGLVRAVTLDYLHAVLTVQVEKPLVGGGSALTTR